MRFRHITFRVRDMEKSIRFYEEMAGLTVERRFRSDPAEVAFLANARGETEVELLYIPGGQTFEGKGMFLCFQTDDLEGMYARAGEKGLSPSPVQTPGDGTRYFYLYDPDGVSVQLRTFPAQD